MTDSIAPESGGEKQGFTPPASQDELNRIIAERLDRERKKFSDYDDLKAKAAQLDALENSKKSDEQKHQERIAALEKDLANTKFAAERARIQARYSITDEDADLFLTASDPERLEAQAKALAERSASRKKKEPHVPNQTGGESGPFKVDPMRELAQRLFDPTE